MLVCTCNLGVHMRTTIALDEDVLKRIKTILKKEGKTMREVVNSALRKAFSIENNTPDVPYKVETFNLKFKPGIDTLHLNNLVDDLAIEDFKLKENKLLK